ncbi:peptidase S8/S53 domain-containing protein [Mycena vulgaris]|nr:peptidase S8/S53 domain-containing protein [Mycena vulgaris]
MLALLFFAVATVAAAQRLSSSIQLAKRGALSPGWSRVRRHAPDAILPLRFGLTQPNVDMNTLEELLNQVSHPESPEYGNHWTPARVAKHFSPSDEAVHVVTSWITGNVFAKERMRVSRTKGWVMVNATVAETEMLLSTEYHVYVDESSGVEHIACNAYRLPAHIVPHVALVTPSVDFHTVLGKRSSSTRPRPGHPIAGISPHKVASTPAIIPHSDDLEHCDQMITPACIRALYGLHYTPVAAHKNSFAISEFTPESYRAADLDLFAKTFPSLGPSLVGARPVLKSIDGGALQDNISFDFNIESNLDLEYSMNLVTRYQDVTLFQIGDLEQGKIAPPDNVPGGYMAQDCGTVKPAYVMSTSYASVEHILSREYATRQCAEYAKLGLMGVTVLFSSGDGVRNGCLNPDGSITKNGTIFNPIFPASCPFITGVGGTQINPGAKVTDPESVVNHTISGTGGGFSNYFSMPAYQKDAVAKYLAANPPPYAPTIYNATDRAFPDISANAANFLVAVGDTFTPESGTSTSSPVVGAILAMINDARLAVGKSSIGFINPVIYSPAFRAAFNDIVDGSNPGCGTNGFVAAKGYDPVSGVGTPNFPKLLEQWLLLP